MALCNVHPKSCDQFVDILGQLLNTGEGDHEENLATSLPLVCEGLASLGNIKAVVLKPLLPDICNAMTIISTFTFKIWKVPNFTLLIYCTTSFSLNKLVV